MSDKRDLTWFGGEMPYADTAERTLASGMRTCRGCFSPADESGKCEACKADDEFLNAAEQRRMQ